MADQELTLDQKKALAMAAARKRMAEADGAQGSESRDAPSAPSQFSSFMKGQQPTEDPWWKRFGTGLKDVAVAAGQMGAHAGGVTDEPFVDQEALAQARAARAGQVDQQVSDREKAIQASRPADAGTDWWRLGGNIAGTLPLAALNPALAGAASGALTPVTEGDFLTEKAKQVGIGAFAGKAGEVAGNNLAKLVGPTSNTAKAALLEGGVDLTPGQMAGRTGKRVEEAMKSLPFSGNVVRGAEERSLDSFNVATVNKALDPIGVEVSAKTGREAIQKGQEALSKAYSSVLDQIHDIKIDPDLITDMKAIKASSMELPPGMADQLDAIVNNRVGSRFGQAQAMDGKTFKQVESELTNLSRNLRSSSDAAQRQVGQHIDEVRGALRDAVARQYPDQAKELTKINQAYSQFADVEQAASRRATSESRFTPGDLLQSIKRSDRSPRDRRFAAGEGGPLQKWAEDAYKIIGNKLPDSGTTERLSHVNLPFLVGGLASLPLAAAHTEAGMNMLKNFATYAPETRKMLASGAQKGGNSLALLTAPAANALIGP